MTRISAQEFYDDKDIITQIEKLKDEIGATLIEDITVLQEPESGTVTLVFRFADGTEKRVTFAIRELVNAVATQIDETVTLAFSFSDGTVKTTSFRILPATTVYFQDIHGEPEDNTKLKAVLDSKVDKAEIEQLEVTVEEHDTKINELHATVTQHSSEINTLDSQVGAVVAVLDNVSDEVGKINENKTPVFTEAPNDDRYPTEKLLFDLAKNHVHDVEFTSPPGTVIKSVVEDGNGFVNTLIITLELNSAVTDSVIGNVAYKPTVMGGYFPPLVLPEGMLWANVNERGQISIASNITQPHEGEITIRTTYAINATGRYR